MTRQRPIVVIDGLSCTGKTTVAQRVANEADLQYIGIGAIYRAFAIYFLREHLEDQDIPTLIERLRTFQLQVAKQDDEYRYLVGDVDVTDKLYSMRVTALLNSLGTIEPITQYMIKVVKSLLARKGIVVDGREIAYRAFPHADLYIFLTADFPERVRRRHRGLVSGANVLFEEVAAEVRRRDEYDLQHMKEVLRDIEKARVLDTTDKSVQDVVGTIMRMIDAFRIKLI